MAKKQSDKIRRLVDVQRRIEQMAEAELAETTLERRRLSEAIDETVEAMGSVDGLHLGFSEVYARRITTLTLKDQRLQGLASVQERRVRSERAKGDRLDVKLGEAVAAEDRTSEDEGLYDLIDQLGGLGSSASRKLRTP